MGKVIEVSFKNKSEVQSYETVVWKCLVCGNTQEYDSRKNEKQPRIIIRDAFKKKPQECICKSCSLMLSKLVENEGWNND